MLLEIAPPNSNRIPDGTDGNHYRLLIDWKEIMTFSDGFD